MPCNTCGHPLYIEDDSKQFACPNCSTLEFADPDVIQEKVDEKRELLSKENIIELLKPYSKQHLVLLLVWELNKTAHQFYKTRKTNVKNWVYLNTIISHILEEDGFGDEQFDISGELPEELDLVKNAYAELKKHLDLIDQELQYCAPKCVKSDTKLGLSGEYMIFDSEFHVGFFRCAESLIGASEDSVRYFDVSREEIRVSESMPLSEVDSPEEFGESYFDPILGFVFMMTSEDHSKETYWLNAPDAVGINDVSDFLDYLDNQFNSTQHAHMMEIPLLTATNPELLGICGRRAFGEETWEELKDEILVSEDSIDAYPLLYKLTSERTIDTEKLRKPRKVPSTKIFYPKFYARLLRFQMFPMLKNGEEMSGKQVLDKKMREIGDDFELNLAKYLESEGFDCYFQAWISQSDKREIDVIAVSDSKTLLIEAKHFRPQMGLYSKQGMQKLNEKFDYEIFKEDNGYHDETPSGMEFDNIIQEWKTRDFDSFSFEDLTSGERITENFDQKWLDKDVYSLVISNLTPSYVKKRGIRFLTDVELVKFVEHGEEVFYQTPDSAD